MLFSQARIAYHVLSYLSKSDLHTTPPQAGWVFKFTFRYNNINPTGFNVLYGLIILFINFSHRPHLQTRLLLDQSTIYILYIKSHGSARYLI